MVDVLLENCLVVNVKDKTSALGSIAVEEGKISQIFSENSPLPAAKRVVDATGLVAAPGFIDVHGHLDGDAYSAGLSVI